VGFFTGQGIALEATFAHPAPGGEDQAIVTRPVQMIDASPPGATIHATVFRLTDETVRDALLAARGRGTSVHVLANGSGAADAVGASLSRPSPDGLGEAHRWAGRPFDPTGEWSAYGAIASGPESDLHTKLVLFSATTDPHGRPVTDEPVDATAEVPGPSSAAGHGPDHHERFLTADDVVGQGVVGRLV
jgi:hypothetical protein